MTALIPHPYAPTDAERYVFEARRTNAAGEGLRLVITPRSRPNAVIGSVGIGPGSCGHEFGYWIGVPHWGQGFATEAARALIDAYFAYTVGERLDACARVINPASRRVLERCGFSHQGSGLKAFPARGGVFPVDEFRLDRRTWESLKSWSSTGYVPNPERAMAAVHQGRGVFPSPCREGSPRVGRG